MRVYDVMRYAAVTRCMRGKYVIELSHHPSHHITHHIKPIPHNFFLFLQIKKYFFKSGERERRKNSERERDSKREREGERCGGSSGRRNSSGGVDGGAATTNSGNEQSGRRL
ncbi:hypothetical protein Scep_007890 [Stephania cephalantha]|uniref:Uncharacterized protein n=1 Tax=Stephania cephalantha TaxID=152367 RepID=A0AAP0KCG9_9MAGN